MKNLKLLRLRQDKYQRVTAKAIGVSERQYIRIENGACYPSYETILSLESHFGKPIKELLDEAPNETENKTA